jgi:Protein of unknown function (DUF1566)
MPRSSPFSYVPLLAALCGAAACSDGQVAPQPPSGVGGATGGAGAATAGAADDATGGAAGERADCAAVPAPNGWASWVMPNPLQSGLPNPASYTVSDSQNLVTDDVTGLVWQRKVADQTFTFAEAQQYCACLNIDGTGGWQLPSRIELASLVDWTATSPSIDSSAFPMTADDNFWTASPVVTDPDLVYLVYFVNGHTTYATADYTYHARCVLSAPPAPAERYTIASGSVYDTQTKLTWQQPIPSSRYSWADAQSYCAALELDGGGWRLPSINELQTLVDEARNPSIDAAAFPMTPSEYFWASSAVIDDASRAWTAFFTNGSTYSFAVTAAKNVRCVR